MHDLLDVGKFFSLAAVFLQHQVGRFVNFLVRAYQIAAMVRIFNYAECCIHINLE